MMRLILGVILLINTCPAWAATPAAVSDAGLERRPLQESSTHITRKFLAAKKDNDDDDDDDNDDDGNADNGNKDDDDDTESDKTAFAVETDVDDPQGSYIPLEKLKMMVAGPGVKPRPFVSPGMDVKNKTQAVKKRRRRHVTGNDHHKSLKTSRMFLRSKYQNNNVHHRFLKTSKGIFSMAHIKRLPENLSKSRRKLKGKFKRIRRDGQFQNSHKHLRNREAVGLRQLMADKRSMEAGADKRSEFPSEEDRDDHRSKAWLKKELHSIETLMNATKRRLSKELPGDKIAIPPQLERDLRKIDHDIHIDLKHVSDKHKHDNDDGGEASEVIDIRQKVSGGGGDRFGRTNSHPGSQFVHGHGHHIHIEQQREPSRKYPQNHYGDNTVSIDLKHGFESGPNRNRNKVDKRQNVGLGDHRSSGHRRTPDFYKMIDELEWIKRETDIVRGKTRKIERQLRMRQRYTDRRPDHPSFDTRTVRFPKEQNIHAPISHGGESRDKSEENDYFQRHSGDNLRKFPHEIEKEWKAGDHFGERRHLNKSLVEKNRDRTIANTFNRLQQDLKTLKIKMEAREKFDGTYRPVDSERIPKLPPIFDANYFEVDPAKAARREQMSNTTGDNNKYTGEYTKGMKDFESRTPVDRNEEDKAGEELRNVGDDDIVSHESDVHVPLRRKRSLTKQEARSKTSQKNSGEDVRVPEGDRASPVEILLSSDVKKLKELKSKLIVLNILRPSGFRMQSGYWRAYRLFANTLRQKLLLYLTSRKRYFLNNPIVNILFAKRVFKNVEMLLPFIDSLLSGRSALHNNNEVLENTSDLNSFLAHQNTSVDSMEIDKDGLSGGTSSLMFISNKARSTKTNSVDRRRVHKNVKMEIEDDLGNSVEKLDGEVEQGLDTRTLNTLVDSKWSNHKILRRMRRRAMARGRARARARAKANESSRAMAMARARARSKKAKEAKEAKERESAMKKELPAEKEPVSEMEKQLTREFSQLLKMLPESEEEKSSEEKLYQDDMKQERAFDVDQTISKINREEKEDIDFLKESMATNYLLANSRIRRYHGFNRESMHPEPSDGADLKRVKKTKASSKINALSFGHLRKRSAGAPPSTDITTTAGIGVNARADESLLERDRNMLDRNVLHMMDYYEGKRGNPNLRKKRRARRGGSRGGLNVPNTREWIKSQASGYSNYPEDDIFHPDTEPAYLDTYFPKAYVGLKNARDRLRWFRLLDGEDQLARKIGYLNNMADRLIEDETDPVLMYLSHVTDRKDPDEYRAWARAPVVGHDGREDHRLLQDAIHDFNSNEHERNTYQHALRRKRDAARSKLNKRAIRSDMVDTSGSDSNGNNDDDVNNNDDGNDDINSNDADKHNNDDNNNNNNNDYYYYYYKGDNKRLGKTRAKSKGDDYQFDESQIEEFDDSASDWEDDNEEDDDKEVVVDENIEEINDNDDDDIDNKDDEELDEEENGIEVDDNGRKMESDKPFAYVERAESPKKRASKEVEILLGFLEPVQ